jgi:hypothetical protein
VISMSRRILNQWENPSHSDPSKTYKVTLYEDGSYACSCPQWVYRRKECKHIQECKVNLPDLGELSDVNKTRIDTGLINQPASVTSVSNKQMDRFPKKEDVIEEINFYDRRLMTETLRLVISTLERDDWEVKTTSLFFGMGGFLVMKGPVGYNINLNFHIPQESDKSWGYSTEEHGLPIEELKNILLNALKHEDYDISFVGLTPEPYDPRYSPSIKLVFTKGTVTIPFELNIYEEGTLFSRDMGIMTKDLKPVKEIIKSMIAQAEKDKEKERKHKRDLKILEVPELTDDMKSKMVQMKASSYSNEMVTISEYDKRIIEYLNVLINDQLSKAVTFKISGRKTFELEGDKVVGLRLDWEQLGTFPEIILNFEHLKRLDLSRNGLTQIPLSIERLTELEYLDVSRNKLANLPESLGNLTHLNSLIISENELSTLPPNFQNLQILQHLDFNRNNFNTISPLIYSLKSLEKLYMVENDILELPLQITKMKSLKEFSFGSCNMTNIPYTISLIPHLEQMVIVCHDSKHLPYNIDQLKSLTWLNLYVDIFSVLPPAFGRIPKLETLSIESKKGAHLPHELTHLPSLRMMYLEGEIANVLIHGFKRDRTTLEVIRELERKNVGLYIP